jgi:two-component sensor histidine kinase
MLKNLLLILLPVSSALLATAQSLPDASSRELRAQIRNSIPDSNRVRLLLALGNTYLLKDGRNRYDPDSAYIYLRQAGRLADSLKDPRWQTETLINTGRYYFEINNLRNGKAFFMKAIDYYKRTGNKQREALCWNDLGKCVPDSDLNNIPFKIQCHEQARSIFMQSGNLIAATDALKDIAACHIKQDKTGQAEKELLDAVAAYKAAGYQKLQDTYDLLAQISGSKADLHKEFSYRMKAISSMEATSDTARADYYYARLALTYSDMKMYGESARWITKAINTIKKRGRYEDLYGDVSLLVFDYISIGKPGEALSFLQKIVKEIPPSNLAQKVDLNEEFAHCYVSMKEYARAEPYYLEMMRIFNITSFNKAFYTSHEQMVTDFIYYNQTIGNFYILTKNYKQAGVYYNKILSLPTGSVRPITLGEIHQMQFRVDSASGHFASAIRHFELYQNLHDSLFNATKNKQIQELQIRYETDQKDKDLRLKQQDIALLTNKSQLQEANLKKASLTRNIIIISAILLLSLLFTGYRVKQRHNIQLQRQQDEINKQNRQLQTVLARQEKLIAEKEWLVKEIHHRVKNNLQIVISLLNVQSDYLDNPSAIHAIQESRERMQAIALIHQKLYQPDYGTLIQMKAYIEEMIVYLQNFADVGRIHFQLNIEEVKMDVSQAVPLGLILNEVITNALKYAFPGNGRGNISIDLHQRNEQVFLKIADNGMGFPENFNDPGHKSLGIQLIKLFAEQLDGKVRFENQNGAQVELVFKIQLPEETLSLTNDPGNG